MFLEILLVTLENWARYWRRKRWSRERESIMSLAVEGRLEKRQKPSRKMVLLVNNLGGLSVLELGAITTEVMDQLSHHYDTKPTRTYTGTFMTSLNGPGFFISLLNVVETHLDVGMIELLDASCEAAGWSVVVKRKTWDSRTELKNEFTTKPASHPLLD